MTNLPFHRMVIRFHQGDRPGRRALQFAAEMASAWHVEIVGTFSPDLNLGRIVELPGTREFRLHERKWSSVESTVITRQLDSISRECEHSFYRVLQSSDVQGRFSIDDRQIPGDLIAAFEPDDPISELGGSFLDELRLALSSGAAILIVPRRLAHSRGAIAVLADEQDEQSQVIGRDLALALGERLVSIDPRKLGNIDATPARLEASTLRLLIHPRNVSEGLAKELQSLASRCRIPVLVPPGGVSVSPSGDAS